LVGPALTAQGHTVRLMSPEYVQPYVKAQKTDDRDARFLMASGGLTIGN
jgi:transposase